MTSLERDKSRREPENQLDASELPAIFRGFYSDEELRDTRLALDVISQNFLAFHEIRRPPGDLVLPNED